MGQRMRAGLAIAAAIIELGLGGCAAVVRGVDDDGAATPDSAELPATDDVAPPTWVGIGDVTMEPFKEDSPFPYSGVRPGAWFWNGPGTFSRLPTDGEEALLIIQPLGGTDAARLRAGFESTFRIEFAEIDPTDLGGEQVQTYGADDGTAAYRVLNSPDDEFCVLLVAPRDEVDDLFKAVAIPAAASLRLG